MKVLQYFDYFFIGVFTLEILLKVNRVDDLHLLSRSFFFPHVSPHTLDPEL